MTQLALFREYRREVAMMAPPRLRRLDKPRFGVDEAQAAADAWRFNCGPGALCGVLGMTPDELRPYLGDFESLGYMSPTHMWQALRRLRARHTRHIAGSTERWKLSRLPVYGLARVQWGGPWCLPGVPVKARYTETHWIGCRREGSVVEVFDINAICEGGWLPAREWSELLVPWLLQDKPRADGTWWLTETAEVRL